MHKSVRAGVRCKTQPQPTLAPDEEADGHHGERGEEFEQQRVGRHAPAAGAGAGAAAAPPQLPLLLRRRRRRRRLLLLHRRFDQRNCLGSQPGSRPLETEPIGSLVRESPVAVCGSRVGVSSDCVDASQSIDVGSIAEQVDVRSRRRWRRMRGVANQGSNQGSETANQAPQSI